MGTSRDDEPIIEAISVANAEDILDALPDGLDSAVEERGRSFSGGQRQRLVLVRALLSGAEVLVLVEPTSAVDAHTEARIAERLRDARARQDDGDRHDEPARARPRRPRACSSPTVSPSPTGSHRTLLRSHAGYRDVVTRGEEDE